MLNEEKNQNKKLIIEMQNKLFKMEALCNDESFNEKQEIRKDNTLKKDGKIIDSTRLKNGYNDDADENEFEEMLKQMERDNNSRKKHSNEENDLSHDSVGTSSERPIQSPVLSCTSSNDDVISNDGKENENISNIKHRKHIRDNDWNEAYVNAVCIERKIPIVFGTKLRVDWTVAEMKRRIIRISKDLKSALSESDLWINSTQSTRNRHGVDKKIFFITPKNGKNVEIYNVLRNIFDIDKYNKFFKISWIEWNERCDETGENEKLKTLLKWRNDKVKQVMQTKMKNRGY